MEITPANPTGISPVAAHPAGRQFVEGYCDGRFRVSGQVYDGSVLVLPQRTLPWEVTAFDQITAERLAPVLSAAAEIEILLLGCGPRFEFVDEDLRAVLRERGLVIEPMDSGAACRTYNVLASESRAVAAALIAVD